MNINRSIVIYRNSSQRAYRAIYSIYLRKLLHCSVSSNDAARKLTVPITSDEIDARHEYAVRVVPRTKEEFDKQRRLRPVQPIDPRYLRVAVVGDANAGKSTLTNQLTGWRVCSVSCKVHTTRRASSTVLNVNDTQVEFTDTPGVISFQHCMKHNIENSMLRDPENAAEQADILLALVDASNRHTCYQLSSELKTLLERHKDKRSVLVLNKVDSVRERSTLLKMAHDLCNGLVQGQPIPVEEKEKLILPGDKALKKQLMKEMQQRLNRTDLIQQSTNLKGWSSFSKIFMVSAKEGEGVNSLLDYLLKLAPKRLWKYHTSVIVNNEPQVLAKNVIREKLLDMLKEEIGYKLKVQIISWEINEADVLRISVTIKCPKKNLVSIVIGPSGKYISELSQSVQQELCNVFHCEVQVHIGVMYEPLHDVTKTQSRIH